MATDFASCSRRTHQYPARSEWGHSGRGHARGRAMSNVVPGSRARVGGFVILALRSRFTRTHTWVASTRPQYRSQRRKGAHA